MPQFDPESEPTFTLTEVIEYGLTPEQNTLAAAAIAGRLMDYAAGRKESEAELPETVNTEALLAELHEDGRFISRLVTEAIGRVAAREATEKGKEQ
jgi:hypothetical protein